MKTDTEKNIAIGAAIGIVSAMASARIATSDGASDSAKMSQDARIIASTMLGTDVPETDEAVLGLVKAFEKDQFLSEMTFADVVDAIEQSNKLHSKTVDDAVAEAEKGVSPDVVSLHHIDAHTDKLVDVMSAWTAMDYEHERLVSSIPRPDYADALAQARANGIKAGYYDPQGGISDGYVERLREQVREEKAQAEREAEDAELAAQAASSEGESTTATGSDEDSFFADIAEKISSPMGDEVAERETTGEFEVVRGAHAGVDLTNVPEVVADDADLAESEDGDDVGDVGADGAAQSAPAASDGTGAVEEDFDVDEPDDSFSSQATQELPPVEIPPAEVLEILEPEPVEDSTEPIVMDPNDVVEAIVEEAADAVDDEVVAGVVEDMAEEMIEAAELDPEECKSFTDEFMAIEIGEDGKARPKQSAEGAQDEQPAEQEEAFASLYDVEEGVPASVADARSTEEILGIAEKTREAIKRAMKSQSE